MSDQRNLSSTTPVTSVAPVAGSLQVTGEAKFVIGRTIRRRKSSTCACDGEGRGPIRRDIGRSQRAAAEASNHQKPAGNARHTEILQRPCHDGKSRGAGCTPPNDVFHELSALGDVEIVVHVGRSHLLEGEGLGGGGRRAPRAIAAAGYFMISHR